MAPTVLPATTWLGRLAADAATYLLPDMPQLHVLIDYLHVGNPVRQFQLLYCLWLAVALMVTLGRQVRFLEWFDGSGCARSKRP